MKEKNLPTYSERIGLLSHDFFFGSFSGVVDNYEGGSWVPETVAIARLRVAPPTGADVTTQGVTTELVPRTHVVVGETLIVF